MWQRWVRLGDQIVCVSRSGAALQSPQHHPSVQDGLGVRGEQQGMFGPTAKQKQKRNTKLCRKPLQSGD